MRILRNLRISEISSVDKGAGDGCRIVLFKRDPDVSVHKQDYSEADDDVVVDLDAVDASGDEKHFAEQIADLLVRSGRFNDKAEALDFLLSTQHGAALLQRLRAAKRATTTKGIQKMNDPDFEVVTIAKAFADTGRAFWSEHQLTQKIFDYAQLDKRENETPHQAFSRHFTANDEQGRIFRKAIAVAKRVGLTPVEIEGRQVGDQDVDVGDPGEALRQIEAIIAQVRARSPDLTQSAAWQKARRASEAGAGRDQATGSEQGDGLPVSALRRGGMVSAAWCFTDMTRSPACRRWDSTSTGTT
jgi:hypothetical protein